MHGLKTKSKAKTLRHKPPTRSVTPSSSFSTTTHRLSTRATSSASFSTIRARLQALQLTQPFPLSSEHRSTVIPGRQFVKFCEGQLSERELADLPAQLTANSTHHQLNPKLLQHLDITFIRDSSAWPATCMPSTALELFAIHRGGPNSSILLQTISKLSKHPDIVDIVTNAFEQPHTQHILPSPHQNLYHYETRQRVCDEIQNRPIDLIIVDQTFQAALGRGHNQFAPSNLRVVQPAFVPLLCAIDQTIQDFFTKPKGEHAQAQNGDDKRDPSAASPILTAPKPMNEMCQAIFNPPKSCPNLFVFSGPAGLGKTEMLNAGLHRAALMGKNVLLVGSQTRQDFIQYSLVNFASSSVKSFQRPHYSSNGESLLRMLSDISTLLGSHRAGPDVLVVVDPPEFDHDAKFRAFHNFVNQPKSVAGRNPHQGPLFAYDQFYAMLAQEHPNTFFLAAQPASLPRPQTLISHWQLPGEANDCQSEQPPTPPGGDTKPEPFAVSNHCLPLHLLSFPHLRFPGLRLTQSTMDKTAKLMLLANELGKQTTQGQTLNRPELLLKSTDAPQLGQLHQVPQSTKPVPSFNTDQPPPDLAKPDQPDQPSQQSSINSLVQSIDAASSVDLSKLDQFLYPHVSEPALATLLRRVVPSDSLAEFESKLSQAGVHGAFTYRSYFTFLALSKEDASKIARNTARLLYASHHQLVLPELKKVLRTRKDYLEAYENRHKKPIKLAPPYNHNMGQGHTLSTCREMSNIHDFNDSLDRPTSTLSCFTRASGYSPGVEKSALDLVENIAPMLKEAEVRPAHMIQSMLRCPSTFKAAPEVLLVNANTHLAQFSQLDALHLHHDFPTQDNKGKADVSSTWTQYHAHLAASGQGTFTEIFPSNGSATYRIGDDTTNLLPGEQIERLYGLGRHIAALPTSTTTTTTKETSPYNTLMEITTSTLAGLDFAVIDKKSKKFYGLHALDNQIRPQELPALTADYQNLCKLHVDIINTGIIKGGKPKLALQYGGMLYLTQHNASRVTGLKKSRSYLHPYIPYDAESLFQMVPGSTPFQHKYPTLFE